MCGTLVQYTEAQLNMIFSQKGIQTCFFWTGRLGLEGAARRAGLPRGAFFRAAPLGISELRNALGASNVIQEKGGQNL